MMAIPPRTALFSTADHIFRSNREFNPAFLAEVPVEIFEMEVFCNVHGKDRRHEIFNAVLTQKPLYCPLKHVMLSLHFNT